MDMIITSQYNTCALLDMCGTQLKCTSWLHLHMIDEAERNIVGFALCYNTAEMPGTVQPERNAQIKFSFNQFGMKFLAKFTCKLNATKFANWLITKFSSGVSFWLYCIM